MAIDPWVVLGSGIVGVLVGLTGAGGGALMTPMLILVFSISPSVAIPSDLVAAVIMRPFGAAVHLRRGTVNLRLVWWLSVGSVPAAVFGAYLLKLFGDSSTSETNVERALGIALLVGATAMLLRVYLDRRSGAVKVNDVAAITVRPLRTVLIGVVGGIVVGMTSVGSGSLMIVLLLFLYPTLGASQLVGTDLTQAVPLTLAAAAGSLLFGHVSFSVTLAVVLGSVPGVLLGAWGSARAPDRVIRPAIIFVILASGLKYVGLGTTPLGWTMVGLAGAGGATWAVTRRPWRRDERSVEQHS